MSNDSFSVPTVTRMAKQVWRGIPYVQKELVRSLSMRTGRTLATPQMYYVIFSGRCNVACTFCTIYKEVEPMLSPEVMLRIVREAKELSGSGFNISLSGGEPLIYKPLYDALDLAHKLNVNFGFTTNGYLLTKQNVARALASNLFNINVSIESVTPEVNESVRPRKNGTQQTLEGIDNLVMEKRRTGARVSIIVKTTIMEQNYRTLPELVRYFSKYKEVQVSFQPYLGPIESGFWIKDVLAFERVAAELKELLRAGCGLVADEATLDGFVGYFQNPPKPGQTQATRLNLDGKKRGCDIGYRSLSIYPNGAVQFCDLLQRDIGNVNTQNLKDIYYGEVAARLRDRIDYCNIDCQRTCQRAIPITTKMKAFLRMG
jgi:[mycofactocin precursor peptide]-tyrosine decarboxylase / 3-amino-5-[(4-hydroxyphenyl)methyl]-4,4-dimethylpyrrolidin-2-one synthase